jgi:hypothetical protein
LGTDIYVGLLSLSLLSAQLMRGSTVTHIYPGIFLAITFSSTGAKIYDGMTKWSQTIRDKEFLVEMRLRNHDPEKEEEMKRIKDGQQPASETQQHNADGDVEVDDGEGIVDADVGGAQIVE